MDSFFALSGLINAVTSTILGLFVFLKDTKNSVNKTFALFCLSVAAWSYAYMFWPLASDASTALIWFRLLHIGAVFAPITYLHFVTQWLGSYEKHKKIIYVGYAMAITIILFIFTPYFIVDMIPKFSMRYWAVPGVAYHFYLLVFFSYAIYASYLLVGALKKSYGMKREQIKLILIGLVLAFSAGSTNYFLWYNINIPPYLNILVTGYVIITAYAILAHHLFDIRVIIKKTIIYSTLLAFVLATFSLLIFLSVIIFGTREFVINWRYIIPNIIAAIIVAVGFEPLRNWLTRVTDKWLFKGEYDSQKLLNKISQILSSVLDLDEALDSIIQTLVSDMRLECAAAFVLTRDPEKKALSVKRAKGIGYQKEELTLESKNHSIEFFEDYIQAHKKSFNTQKFIEKKEPDYKLTRLIKPEEPRVDSKPIIVEELEKMMEMAAGAQAVVKNTLDELKKLKAAVVFPIIVKNNLVGIILLGNKKSGDIFTETDLNILNVIAGQSASAIEKARFYEEDQLKSEFVSIASHELLTPTSAIEGYLSMILEEDMGKIDKKARGYLEKVYASSKRLANLVKDLLNVSRIEGGRIIIQSVNFDISKMIQDVVSEMMPKAKEKNLQLLAEGIDRTLPQIWADPDRVHQALVNLIGNAIKYTDKGSVRVRTDYSLSVVRVSVIDTGVGIPKEELAHLFEKFYRASNADANGAQGTGLGLYITKNIIELMGGIIQVDSEMGRGSVFSFSLPRAKESK